MRTKTTIGILVLVLAFYAALIGFKGVALLAGGALVGKLLGVALLVMPLLGLYVVWREIEFGLDVLKADGVSVFTSYGDVWLGDPKFEPVMAEFNRRSVNWPGTGAFCSGVEGLLVIADGTNESRHPCAHPTTTRAVNGRPGRNEDHPTGSGGLSVGRVIIEQ